jgi:hypothetical protein
MPDFDPAQFVIGTSAWGSRIPVSRAVSVGAALVDAGFARFDSAPTYGSSYAHYALNRLADKPVLKLPLIQNTANSTSGVFAVSRRKFFVHRR